MSAALLKKFEKYILFIFLECRTQQAALFCQVLETAVDRLPSEEKTLIESRYLAYDSEYLTDGDIYNSVMRISATYYTKIRKRAFYKLNMALDIKKHVSSR